MPPPISSSLTALKAYNQPDQKKPQARADIQAPEKAAKSRRTAPALTVQLSAEAQKILQNGGAPQKLAAAQKTSEPESIQSVKSYENGVGRREAPLSESSAERPVRPARMGSTLDIKV